MSLAPAPAAARIAPSFANIAVIPPAACTPYHATPITMLIFKTN
jgi:hypothetical protein